MIRPCRHAVLRREPAVIITIIIRDFEGPFYPPLCTGVWVKPSAPLYLQLRSWLSIDALYGCISLISLIPVPVPLATPFVKVLGPQWTQEERRSARARLSNGQRICDKAVLRSGCTFDDDSDPGLCEYRQGQEDDFDWQLIRTYNWPHPTPDLLRGTTPPRQAQYVNKLPGIGGLLHGSLLITLPGVPQGPRQRHKGRFSSSFHPLEKVDFRRDEHMLG
ncbi:hypothetical protein PAMA_011251 [Pampus argenteus]